MKYPATDPAPVHTPTPRPGERAGEPESHDVVTSRLTTDGTRYLPETYFSTDGTRELPNPMIDPQTGRRGFQTDWPIGDPRRDAPDHKDAHDRR